MGLLKNKKRGEEIDEIPELPELPKLPKLPEFEAEEKSKNIKSIHQLPRFPNGSLGEKFSRNTIKEAVAGEKEGGVFADEFADDEEQMMQEPQKIRLPPTSKKRMVKEESYDNRGIKNYGRTKENEPIFIRIDKFEEGMKSLDKAREQISEIEKLLRDIQEIRGEEEKELESWEKEIQITKTEIEKIDNNIFSKVE